MITEPVPVSPHDTPKAPQTTPIRAVSKRSISSSRIWRQSGNEEDPAKPPGRRAAVPDLMDSAPSAWENLTPGRASEGGADMETFAVTVFRSQSRMSGGRGSTASPAGTGPIPAAR